MDDQCYNGGEQRWQCRDRDCRGQLRKRLIEHVETEVNRLNRRRRRSDSASRNLGQQPLSIRRSPSGRMYTMSAPAPVPSIAKETARNVKW
jgi:hypothetical protein